MTATAPGTSCAARLTLEFLRQVLDHPLPPLGSRRGAVDRLLVIVERRGRLGAPCRERGGPQQTTPEQPKGVPPVQRFLSHFTVYPPDDMHAA